MKDIKEIFGVEIEEKFDIDDKKGCIYHNCYFGKDKELVVFNDYDTESWSFEDYLLRKLISGEAEIIKRKPEILNNKEKEFLSFIVNHLGRDEVESIVKISCGKDEAFIKIKVRGENFAAFPDFPKGTMYKGMENGKSYTLKELGI